MDVGLAGIHPPSIYANGVEVVVHLLPEKLARPFRISVIERLLVAEPVDDVVVDRNAVHPPVPVHFLEMLGIGVELGPDAYHEPAAHGVDGVHHGLRAGVAVLVEFMAAPLVVVPVLPVLHDVVHGDAALAEFLQCGYEFELVGIALAALPVAHGPFGHDLGLASQGAVAADDLVDIVALDEIVVYAVLHLAPPGHLVLDGLFHGTEDAETAVAGTAVRLPFDPDGHFPPFLEIDCELVAVGVPCGTPDLGDDLFAVDEYLGVAGIVQEEAECAALLGLQLAFEGHVRPGEIEVGRTLDLLAFGRDKILLVDGGLAADQGVLLRPVGAGGAARGRDVSPCQRALFTVFVIKGEHFSQMQVIPRVTPAKEGVAVPEDAVVPG